MNNVTVANGRGTTEGGGLRNLGSTKLVNCTFLANSSVGSLNWGGAIHQESGSLTVLGCSFLHNIAVGTNSLPGLGGAISARYALPYGDGGPIFITNSTFFGNSASVGGAIYNTCNPGTPSRIMIVNCTFADNTNNAVASGCVTLKNTIVRGTVGPNFSGPIIDGGHNISSDKSGNFTNAFSLNSTDSLLGPLIDNGGPTLTLALLSGSPAIDAGDDSAAPETDQRGFDRLYGFASDIGAFEKNGPIYSIQGLIQGFGTPTNLIIAAGPFHTNPPNLNYVLRGLSNGTYTVTPAAAAFIFVPASRLVSVGPTNTFHVDYTAYRSNGLAIERIGSGDFRCAYAGATGQTFVVQTSTNLKTWSAFSTNQIGTNGIFEWHDTNSPPLTIQWFRAVMP